MKRRRNRLSFIIRLKRQQQNSFKTFVFIFYLKSKFYTERRNEREGFLPSVGPLPKGLEKTRCKPGAMECFQISYVGVGSQGLGLSFIALPGHKWKDRVQMEQPEVMPISNVGILGCRINLMFHHKIPRVP